MEILRESHLLNKETKKDINDKYKNDREDKLNERDIKELMGVYKPVYSRHRGALRQR